MSSNTTSTDVAAQTQTQTPSASSTDTPTTSSTPAVSTTTSDSSSSAAASTTQTPTTSTPTTSQTVAPSTTSTPSTTPQSTSSTTSTTSTEPGTTSSSISTDPSTTSSASVIQTTVTKTPTSRGGSTITVVSTSTESGTTPTGTSSSTSSSSSAASTAGLQGSGTSASSGLTGGGKIAVAVVVPIVAVALIVLALLFLWRKRRQRKDAEELRRKEVEEYGYNPNNDPTLPPIGSSGHDGPFEMREDASGYRGWGTTAVASSGRKASTTLSGGQSTHGIGMAYSEGTSPTNGPISDTRSDNPLMNERPISGEQEPLGAMGPAASDNRSGAINRGPSNASSSYSAANRSDGSGEIPGSYGSPQYYNQYDTGSPFGPNETAYGGPPGRTEMSGQPIIRDVQARRNTRIENPSHFPQQSAGISQNF